MKKAYVTILLSFTISILSVYSMSFLACADDDDTEPTPTPEPDIIPGQKMYQLYIDDPFSTCRDLYGEPDDITYGYSTEVGGNFLAKYDNPWLYVWIIDMDNNEELSNSEPIWQINIRDVTNWSGTTAGGNGIGSTLDSIMDEFGPCEGFSEYFCIYNLLGIQWWFYNDNPNCYSIIILPPT